MEVVQVGFDNKPEKPVLLYIVQKHGLPIDGARINYEVPTIEGFIAIESQSIRHATQYIAIDNIASFEVLDEESFNILAAFPKRKVEIKR